MYKHKINAFTLVELIVVIVILAILATIAFLSFSSYSSSARDSVRLSDMTNISKGLVLLYTNGGKYPIPDDYINITASGTTIGYQGYAGIKALDIANLSSGKDPLDTDTYYTYNTNINQNKYQIMGFLEDGGNINLSYYDGFSNIVEADNNYSKRFISSKGDGIGILLNSGTNTPIQYNNSGTGFELSTATGTNYFAYINKTTSIRSTGSMIGGLAGFYTTMQASSTYPGCDTPDIKLSNGQVWAACNVGASQAFNGISLPYACTGTGCISDPYPSSHNIYGSYFQWGRNDDVTSTTSTSSLVQVGTLANNVGHNYFINGFIDINYDWINSRNPDLWGGSGTTYTSGTYYTRGNPIAMQGPCNNGYHIPTMLEWSKATLSINPSLVTSFGAGRQNDKSVINLLKIPFAGYRYYSNGNYMYQWAYGHYWASSSTSSFGHMMLFGFNKIYILNGTYRAGAFSVRCIKN